MSDRKHHTHSKSTSSSARNTSQGTHGHGQQEPNPGLGTSIPVRQEYYALQAHGNHGNASPVSQNAAMPQPNRLPSTGDPRLHTHGSSGLSVPMQNAGGMAQRPNVRFTGGSSPTTSYDHTAPIPTTQGYAQYTSGSHCVTQQERTTNAHGSRTNHGNTAQAYPPPAADQYHNQPATSSATSHGRRRPAHGTHDVDRHRNEPEHKTTKHKRREDDRVPPVYSNHPYDTYDNRR